MIDKTKECDTQHGKYHINNTLVPTRLLTRLFCVSGPLLSCVVVETQAGSPNGQTAAPPAPAPALSSGPIAAMVLVHTVRGLSTASHLPADKTPGTT